MMSFVRQFPLTIKRSLTTAATASTKSAGDISAVFPSLSGKIAEPLPPRFKNLKQTLIAGNAREISASWTRLLDSLQQEIEKIKTHGSSIIPSIQYEDVRQGNVSRQQLDEIRHRGSVVIRGVMPKPTALKYKQRAQDYIAANRDRVRAFPKDDPAVYELYWSSSQVDARAHPNMLATQRFLNTLWHSSDPDAPISVSHPLTYADRFRIRNPGDAKFALGPHSDGGSLERWEDPEYRKCYKQILQGQWEEYDPFDAAHRVKAKQDLYNGAGTCSMLRFFQGWLSMSSTGPGEGTLRICPLLKHATAYLMLRPLFTTGSIDSLDAAFPGSAFGAGQEYNESTHPHLQLNDSMCSIPHVEPGDYVAWHCDTIHSVDKEHRGTKDSSVMYIPACPMTPASIEYLLRQRAAATAFSPPPDFPDAGGLGEQGFTHAQNWKEVSLAGMQAMGMGRSPWETHENMTSGERKLIDEANRACFT